MYLVCPLCGLHSHLNRFKPEELKAIIELIEMRSLGRARGWEVSGRFSALDDKDLMNRIANRCRKILEIIGEEVTEKSSVAALKKKLGEWRNEALGLRDENAEIQKSLEENIDEVGAWQAESEELIARVNEAFNSEYEELEDAVDFLLEVALEE